MHTWFFTLDAGPLTPWKIEQLDASGSAGAVSLSPHADGTIAAAVEAETIREAFAFGRLQVDDAIGKRPRVTALHGDLEGSVADVVFRAAARLRIDAASILLEHLAVVWYREALAMAAAGAIDEQHYDGHGNPKRAFVVRPMPWNEISPTEMVMTWEAIYTAARGYLDGTENDGTAARDLAGDQAG